jgi:transposase
VKTDRRDAELLARLLLAGELHPVRVPGDEEEALRDLVRAREAVRVDLMRCRHRLSKLLLLRHGVRFADGAAWTHRHRDWLATIALDWPAARRRCLTAGARSTRSPIAASGWSARSSRRPPGGSMLVTRRR